MANSCCTDPFRPGAPRKVGSLGRSVANSLAELYMLAFRPALRSSFSDRELKQLADLMTERDLRIRKATSDFWDPLSPPDSPVSLDSPEVADDELQVLRDEEALKPYK